MKKHADEFPVIDVPRTGQRIKQLMQRRKLDVRDVQEYLGLSTSQSIYHWLNGDNMPSVDNLYALSGLFHVSVDSMLCGNRDSILAENRGECQNVVNIPAYNRLMAYYNLLGKTKTA